MPAKRVICIFHGSCRYFCFAFCKELRRWSGPARGSLTDIAICFPPRTVDIALSHGFDTLLILHKAVSTPNLLCGPHSTQNQNKTIRSQPTRRCFFHQQANGYSALVSVADHETEDSRTKHWDHRSVSVRIQCADDAGHQ